jgi:DNA-directed RNA polymerase subunit RPC12/RpoP
MTDYIIVRRTNGEVTDLECPNCGSTSLALVDIVTEWRPLSVNNSGDIYIGEDNNAEGMSDGYVCMDCASELDFSLEDNVENLLTYA